MNQELSNRKDRERLFHQQEIFKATEKLIQEQGFDSITMDDIAKKAEFAKGTLYKYFKNKEALILSLLENKMDALIESIQAIQKQKTHPLDKIKKTIQIGLESKFKDRFIFQAIFLAQYKMILQKERLVKKIQAHMLEFDKIIAEAQAAGEIRKMDTRFLTQSLFGLMQGLLMMVHCEDTPIKNPEEFIQNSTDQIFDLFYYGVKA